MNLNNNEGLKREIGLIGLAANAVNSLVGGGIFVLPAIVALRLGSASILAYLLCGIVIISIMLCFAEIGSMITVSGGAYAYVEAAFGSFFGFLTNSLFWFGFGILSDAAIANAMADMLAVPFPWLLKKIYRIFFFIIVFGGFAWINIKGVKQGIRIVKINTLAKLIPLLILITLGWIGVSLKNFEWEQIPSIKDLGEMSLILFFAFAGGEVALNNSGEVKNPKRTVPYGILLGIGVVIILYMLIQTVSQGVLGAELPNYKEAPLAEVAKVVMGDFGPILIITGAVISIFGALSGGILAFPRLLFAGAKDNLLPKFLGEVHKKFATPVWAIVTYTFFDLTFSITGGFKQLAIVSSAALLTIYLGVVLSTIKLRLKNKPDLSDTFKIPGGLIIPVFAIISIMWFLSHLAKNEAIGIGIFLVVLSAIYAVMKVVKNN